MLLFSEMCRRAKVDENVIQTLLAQKRDFDVDQLTRKVRAADNERRSVMVRAYAKSEVSKAVLSNFSTAYDAAELIADIVCPVMPGSIERQYPKWAKRDTRRVINTEIGSDGTIPKTDVNVSFATYKEKGQGAQTEIDLNAVAQSSQSLDLMETHEMQVMSDILMSREIRIATKYMTAGNYLAGCTSALAGNNRWDVAAGTSTADPLKDIRITMKTAIALGAVPNVAIGSSPVLEYLRAHPKVVAAAGAKASDRVVGLDELARLIGVEKIVEGKAKYDGTGNAVNASEAFVWGKGFVLAKVQPGAGLNQKTFMKTFRHTDLAFRDERDGTRGVRGITLLIGTHEDADEVVMNDAAYLLDTVIS